MTNSKRSDQLASSYQFLLSKERDEQPFTIEELCAACDWKEGTARTYLTKKWRDLVAREDGHYVVHGVSQYTEEEYLRLMSQSAHVSSDPKRPQLEQEVEQLVIKAREAAINALDSYNRPATLFRTEGFTVMMVIAWRSLFHAIFERRGIQYIYLEKNWTAQTYRR